MNTSQGPLREAHELACASCFELQELRIKSDTPRRPRPPMLRIFISFSCLQGCASPVPLVLSRMSPPASSPWAARCKMRPLRAWDNVSSLLRDADDAVPTCSLTCHIASKLQQASHPAPDRSVADQIHAHCIRSDQSPTRSQSECSWQLAWPRRRIRVQAPRPRR